MLCEPSEPVCTPGNPGRIRRVSSGNPCERPANPRNPPVPGKFRQNPARWFRESLRAVRELSASGRRMGRPGRTRPTGTAREPPADVPYIRGLGESTADAPQYPPGILCELRRNCPRRAIEQEVPVEAARILRILSGLTCPKAQKRPPAGN